MPLQPSSPGRIEAGPPPRSHDLTPGTRPYRRVWPGPGAGQWAGTGTRRRQRGHQLLYHMVNRYFYRRLF